MTIQALYYDGQSAQAQSVRLQANASGFTIENDGVQIQVGRSEFELMEPAGNAPRKIVLLDQGELELPVQEGLNSFLSNLGHRDGWLVSIQSNLKWALLATFSIVLLGVIFYLKGLPVLSQSIAEHVPVNALQSIDQQSFQVLDEQVFQASDIPAEKQEQIRRQFAGFVRDLIESPMFDLSEEVPYRIEFRKLKTTANAMAFRGGTIVLLDGLTTELTDPEIQAVLAHELAHVVHRHALTQLIRSSFVGMAFAFTVGDFSFLGSSVLLGLGDLAMTRGMEREADEFAVKAFAATGQTLQPLLEVHAKLMQLNQRSSSAQGSWLDYLKTHPSGQERQANMKALWRSLGQAQP